MNELLTLNELAFYLAGMFSMWFLKEPFVELIKIQYKQSMENDKK